MNIYKIISITITCLIIIISACTAFSYTEHRSKQNARDILELQAEQAIVETKLEALDDDLTSNIHMLHVELLKRKDNGR